MERSTPSAYVARLHILLYLPNIIGYIRILCLLGSLPFALYAPITAISLYFTSAILDALDGYLARRLGQSSSLGAVLDYSIDRASICVMQIILALIFPYLWIFFALILALDIASHISHVYTSLFMNRRHHKEFKSSSSQLLNLYYSKRWMLFLSCFSHDMWFGFVYLHHFYPEQLWIWLGSILFIPGFILKTLIHILQLLSAFQDLISLDHQTQRFKHSQTEKEVSL